jgi:NADH-quinone oxidoreductase subunit G
MGLTQGGRKLGTWAGEIASGKIKALLVLGGEDVVKAGVPETALSRLEILIASGILPNGTTKAAHVVLPGAGFAEKSGSMVNVHGRLQRLTRAVAAPGQAREDWVFLRDLRETLTGGNSLHSIEDIWKAMAAAVPAFAGLSWAKIGDQGVSLEISRPSAVPVKP